MCCSTASATSSATTGRTSSPSWLRRASCTSARSSRGSSDARGYVSPQTTPLAPAQDLPQPWDKTLCSLLLLQLSLGGGSKVCPHFPPGVRVPIPLPCAASWSLAPEGPRSAAACPRLSQLGARTLIPRMQWEQVGGLAQRDGAQTWFGQCCLLLPGAAPGATSIPAQGTVFHNDGVKRAGVRSLIRGLRRWGGGGRLGVSVSVYPCPCIRLRIRVRVCTGP